MEGEGPVELEFEMTLTAAGLDAAAAAATAATLPLPCLARELELQIAEVEQALPVVDEVAVNGTVLPGAWLCVGGVWRRKGGGAGAGASDGR